MWMYIVAGIVLALAALLMSPIVIGVRFEEDLLVTVRFWCFRFRVYPKKESSKNKAKKQNKKKQNKKKQNTPQDGNKKAKPAGAVGKVQQVFQVLHSLFHGSLRLLKGARLRKLNLTIGATGEDAAQAAINYGTVCSIAYPFLGLVDSHMKLVNPKVNIYCDYLAEEWVIQGSGSLYISVFHAVGTALYIFKDVIMKFIKR